MVIFFKPVFKETLWGGKKLSTAFGLDIPSEKTGECWGISAHPNGESTVLSGPYGGWSLSRLYESNRELFGHHPAETFPILVKLIDAQQDLSIQVHPDDARAKALGSFGKTECWYILDAENQTDMVIGHHASSREAFVRMVEDNAYEALVNRFKVHAGDFFYIPAGTLHAICAGTLLLEVQQSSDITYRFYDYDRLENGKKRPLHLEAAIEAVTIPDQTPLTEHDDRYFGFDIVTRHRDPVKADRYGDFLVVIEGEGLIDEHRVKKGDFLFISADSTYVIDGPLRYARITLRA